ncbi:MAG: DUF2087 domain-containing protein [Acidimicrobiales bacterium]
MLTAERLVGLLAEPDRRRVVAAMVLGAIALDDIATTAGIATRTAIDALHRLADAGLVESGAEDSWILIEGAFKQAARAARPTGDPTAHADEPDDRRRVLEVAFRDGKLAQWPAKRTKRLVVLDHLAQRFEPGVRYSERQVNALLRPVDDDTSTMRRYLVDEGFLDRADGEYWRSGGTV